MGKDCDALTRDELVLWIMNAFECAVTNDYYAVLERLHPLSYEELHLLDKIASEGPSKAHDLRDVLLSEAEMQDILMACPLAYRYERHTNVRSIVHLMEVMRSLGIGFSNLETHVVADLKYVYVLNGGNQLRDDYVDNPDFIRLIEEYPDRMNDITEFRVKRRTSDAALIREALNIATPLADGTL